MKTRQTFRTGRTLKDVRRELRKARMENGVAVNLTFSNWFRPRVVWHSIKFVFKNRRRIRILKTMSDKSMGRDWRDSRPKKLQRKLGHLPQLT
jgi:hypothetical protein